MTKEQRPRRNPANTFGHGLNRAKKTNRKKHSRSLKHIRRWIEEKMDNK